MAGYRAIAGDETVAYYLDRRVRSILVALAVITILAIAVPALYLVIWSFWGTEVVGRLASPSQWSLKWFSKVLGAPDWQESIVASALLAIAASGTGVALNAFYGYAKTFISPRLKTVTSIAMVLVLLNPLIAYGMALRSMGATHELSPWLLLYFGHVVVLLPLQFLVFEAAEGTVPDEMLWASRSLGAGHVRTIVSVFLPNARSAVLGAFLLGFFISLDELVLALFTLDLSGSTVPLRLWRGLSHVITPEAAVLSTLLLILSVLAFQLQQILSAQSRAAARQFHERLGDFPKETYLGLIAAALTTLLDLHIRSAAVSIAVHAGIAVATWASVAFSVGIARAYKPIFRLVAIGNAEKPGLHDVTRHYVFDCLDDGIDDAERLRDGAWVNLEWRSLRRLTALCFRECGSRRYIGTDSNIPSVFYRRYPDYIDTQLQRGTAGGDVRILFCDLQALKADAAANHAAVTQFMRDHASAGVTLLSVPKAWAVSEARRQQLPSPEFGLFGGKFVLFFDKPSDDEAAARVTIRRMTKTLSARLNGFLMGCADSAQRIALRSGDQPVQVHLDDRAHYRDVLRTTPDA